MKTLQLQEMENLQGGRLTKCEIGVLVGCGVASAAIGFVTFGGGFAFALYCGGMAEGFDTCE